MSTYLKESVEFQEIAVTLDGVPETAFEVCMVPYGQRPATWEPATVVSGKAGIMIQDQEKGEYSIFVRVQGNPETPVLNAGLVTIR